MLEPVMGLLVKFDVDFLYVDSPANNLCRVNAIYDLVVSEVHSASLAAIPVHKKGYQKFWWDQVMNLGKNKAIRTHTAWTAAGKPRSGPIFLARNLAKYAYRLEIKTNRNKEKFLFSNSLQSNLCSKKQF